MISAVKKSGTKNSEMEVLFYMFRTVSDRVTMGERRE